MQNNKKIALYKYIVEFAKKHEKIRIELGKGLYFTVMEFNLATTGATIFFDHKEPTLSDLASLPIPEGEELPFDSISLRKSDCGPDLATLEFRNKQFELSVLNADKNELVMTFVDQIQKISNSDLKEEVQDLNTSYFIIS